MAPSPRPANGRYSFERLHLVAFLLGCCFFLTLWHGYGPSGDPGFDNELHKESKVLRRNTGPLFAVAVLTGTKGVNGTIHFAQDGYSNVTHIKGTVRGLDPNSLRGFHVHAYGDVTEGCTSTGAHYNPTGKLHGGPNSTVRHVGDLGNIQADANGVANFTIDDSQVQLSGLWSVVGRAVVVHTGTDDLGTQDNEGSRTTGNAGERAACGVIGLSPVG